MIETRDLQVVFHAGTANENPALRGITLRIEAGSFVTVIGSNGAGKSTLLNALAGDVPARGGQVLIDGEEVGGWPAHRRAAVCARVFQDPLAGTSGPLTIEENLALADDRGRPRGLSFALGAARRERYRALLGSLGLGLEHRLGDRMDRLSGGQRQAVSLLMATLQPSRILLLDEMTAALDPLMAEFLMQLTGRLIAERRLTAMMVTHSMSQALHWGDRTLMMHRGRVALDVHGPERRRLTVEDLVQLFSRARGEALDQDSLRL